MYMYKIRHSKAGEVEGMQELKTMLKKWKLFFDAISDRKTFIYLNNKNKLISKVNREVNAFVFLLEQ